MKKGIFLGVLIVYLFCIPLISGQPPFQTSQVSNIGFIIESPIQEVQQNGQDYSYDFHVFNITDGVLLTNNSIACVLHLFNSNGDHILESIVPFDLNGVDFELEVEGGNFSDNSLHAVMVNCNVTDIGLIPMGGFLEWSFMTNPSGTTLEEGQSIAYFSLLMGTIFVLLLILWGSVVIPFSNTRSDETGKIISVEYLKYIKILFMSLAYMILVWTFNLLHVLSINFSLLNQYTNYFAIIFMVLNAISLPLFVFIFIGSLFLLWKDLKLEKLLLRGLHER